MLLSRFSGTLSCWSAGRKTLTSGQALNLSGTGWKTWRKSTRFVIFVISRQGVTTLCTQKYNFNFGQVHRCAKECFLFVDNRKISTWRCDRSFANLRAIWKLGGDLHCAGAIIYVFLLNLFASKRTRQSIKISHVERILWLFFVWFFYFFCFVFISK